jgi:hypothetical protein
MQPQPPSPRIRPLHATLLLAERRERVTLSAQNARKFARVACQYLRIIAHAQSAAVHPSAASSFPVLAFSGRTLVLSLPTFFRAAAACHRRGQCATAKL